SSLLVFQEIHPDSICRPFFGTYMDPGNQTRIYHFPASYHNQSGVNGFADAHVETHKWTDRRTIKPPPGDLHGHDFGQSRYPLDQGTSHGFDQVAHSSAVTALLLDPVKICSRSQKERFARDSWRRHKTVV